MNLRLKTFLHSPLYSILRNHIYYQSYEFAENAFRWDPEQIQRWQWDEVTKIVNYAFEHVPFYRRLYQNVGFEPGDLRDWNSFSMLPCITKDDVKAHFSALCSDEIDTIPHREVFTGGSTSQPTRYIVDDSIYYRENAIYRYYWEQTGYRIGDRCILLRGQRPMKQKGQFRVKFNPSQRYMAMDSTYIDLEDIHAYDRAMRWFGTKNIQAYPSSLALLAKVYMKSGLEAPCFEHIYFGSESLFEEQTRIVREVFRPKGMYNQYGHTELVLLALQNPYEEGMGFVPFYGYMELLDSHQNVINSPGVVGEIVGTGMGLGMPLIRYRTNDYAAYSAEPFQTFMKGWKKIDNVEGRLQEYIITADKRPVSLCVVAGAHIPELIWVWDMQYSQEKEGELIMNVVPDPARPFTKADAAILQKRVEAVLDDSVECKVQTVSEITRTKRNKKMMLIQHLNVQEYFS